MSVEEKNTHVPSKADKVIGGVQQLYRFGVNFGLLQEDKSFERYLGVMKWKFGAMSSFHRQRKNEDSHDDELSDKSSSDCSGDE
jgi:hypothetical protein